MGTILSIAGKPGLYKLVSRGKMNPIVESLDGAHRRIPTFFIDRVTNLDDIAVYTDADDVSLWQMLKSVGEQRQSKLVSFNYKKTNGKQLCEYLVKALLSFDQDHVHDNDIRRLLQWYDIFVKSDMANFEIIFSSKKEEDSKEVAE